VVFEALVDALPRQAGKAGKLHADKGYDAKRCHAHLKRRRIKDRIARKGIERNDRLGRHRWVVERSHAWLGGYGKLRIRFERSAQTHVALLSLACCITCIRALI
jgi:IS5 family transposase